MANMMNPLYDIIQTPLPGESKLLFCGDSIEFTLVLSEKIKGSAWIRTNLGSISVARKEIINRVEKNEIKLDEAWHDIKMESKDELNFRVVLPLNQSGYFQAKCFFLPANHSEPAWPSGENCIINVEPAGTCCANIIYNAFVRQFGGFTSDSNEGKELTEVITDLDEKGFTVIPESGKFRDLKKEIRFIFSKLGCRALQLLPVHPVPTTYARMGRFGSPYAAMNFTDVDPGLAEFDPLATPLEQFMELVDTVHLYGGYIIMDIAINHTGWAASIHETNPDWLVRKGDGTIEVPGAWGNLWADLTKLDYSNTDLWKYMADIFLLWCHRGIDGFRCDAGYMIPVDAWEYIVAKVREEYPEVLFLLEGLGGAVEVTCDILGKANFNWAYSELFQNFSKEEINAYLNDAFEISSKTGQLIHFAETHDNNRLASVSTTYAKMRTSMSALFSVCGGFGFTNGVEWFATRKIDVHESCDLNWDSEENQVEHIARLNLILQNHPAFFNQTLLKFIQTNMSDGLVLFRNNPDCNKKLLILVNPDCNQTGDVAWAVENSGGCENVMVDLITGKPHELYLENGSYNIRLAPGEVLALAQDSEDLHVLAGSSFENKRSPGKVYLQKLKTKVLNIIIQFKGYGNICGVDIEKQAVQFADNPVEFIRSLNHRSDESRVVLFDYEKDANRQIMVPPGFFLLVKCKRGFRAEILDQSRPVRKSRGYEEGLPYFREDGYFALFPPHKILNCHKEFRLNLRIFKRDKTHICNAAILYLAPWESLRFKTSFTGKEISADPSLKLLAATNRGGMMRAAAWWGRIESRYDAVLGANMDETAPENRRMVLARYRIWAIYQGYSRELTADCLEKFIFSYDHGGKWIFHVPTSAGKYYVLELHLRLDTDENSNSLLIHRAGASDYNGSFLPDSSDVEIIIRPDIEDRSFHDVVKAYMGCDRSWPDSVNPAENGFQFSLFGEKMLNVKISKGRYTHEPEWTYMVYRPVEASRGLDPESDLFSPGYFRVSCKGNETIHLRNSIIDKAEDHIDFNRKNLVAKTVDFNEMLPVEKALQLSLDAFIVNRGKQKSVIAGYPWFLDWGRDSLIFCRCLIELERFSEAKAILKLFGKFENNGTLPNMICGRNAGNIETSDAPLWFFTCCKELFEKEKNSKFLNETTENRTIREILLSIASSMITGTETGVVADPETMLLYSPAHFTWMDTNYPAGTPRQGYPVEIQALWYNAVEFLQLFDVENQKTWRHIAQQIHENILKLYNNNAGFFSDCLHSDGPSGAKNAVADDALRPNQLLLFSLNVIRDKSIGKQSLETCMDLLIPGAIRSLADRKLESPLNIIYNEQLLKDPHFPYSGVYEGDEDTQRKPAYHNGTAWTWLLPVFCEAWAVVFGENSYTTCLSWIGSSVTLMRSGAVGYIPEILDGDYPHTPRGCDAQAWGTSEAARVIHKLNS